MIQLQVVHANGKIEFVDIQTRRKIELTHDQLVALFEALGKGLVLDVEDEGELDRFLKVLKKGTIAEA